MKPMYRCEYCDKMGTEEDILKHEEECLYNYTKRACYTCKHAEAKVHMDHIGDPKHLTKQVQKIFEGNLYTIHDNGIGVDKINNEDLLSNTLQFDRCERIIFRDKTLDFEFEIPDERYKDIDTIIVNGHKFVREK